MSYIRDMKEKEKLRVKNHSFKKGDIVEVIGYNGGCFRKRCKNCISFKGEKLKVTKILSFRNRKFPHIIKCETIKTEVVGFRSNLPVGTVVPVGNCSFDPRDLKKVTK